MTFKVALIVTLLGFCFACSGENNGNDRQPNETKMEKTNQTTKKEKTHDVEISKEKEEDRPEDPQASTCDENEFLVGNNFFFRGDPTANSGISIYEKGSSEESSAVITIEFYPSTEDAGDSPLQVGPGIYEIGTKESGTTFQTCRTCIRIKTGCPKTGPCEKQYFGSQGRVVIDALNPENGMVSGRITDLVAKEVLTSDANIPVTNGKTFCLASAEFVPECVFDTECTDAQSPMCSRSGVCVACLNSSHCTDPEKPACVIDSERRRTCGVINECISDDTNENNDGPAAAKRVDISTLPASINAKTCSGATRQEVDWFKFTIGEDNTPISLQLNSEDPEAVFEFTLLKQNLEVIGAGISTHPSINSIASVLNSGDYLIVVKADFTPNENEAVGYEIKIESAECVNDTECSNGQICGPNLLKCIDCLSDLDCTDIATPSCGGENLCVSVNACEMDDANEPGSDGPIGASKLILGTPVTNKICGSLDSENFEHDWYQFEIDSPTNVRATLNFANPSNLNLTELLILDENLTQLAWDHKNGILEANALPKGKYYLDMFQFSESKVSVDYTLLIETF